MSTEQRDETASAHDLSDAIALLELLRDGKIDQSDLSISGQDSEWGQFVKIVEQVHSRQSDFTRQYVQNLERTERMVREIIETTPVGICITNQFGIFEYVNPTYTKLYGYEIEELIGEHFTIVVPDDYKAELTRLHDKFMGERFEMRGEWTVLRKDGSQLDILADAAYIVDLEGRPKKVTFVVDISQSKSYQRDLTATISQLNDEIAERERQRKLKEGVERIIRHDLRNPISAILSATQLLRRGKLNEDQKNFVQMIEESGQKANSMLNTAIDLVKMEEGTYELKSSPVDLVEVLTMVRREQLHRAARWEVSLHFMVDDRPLKDHQSLSMIGEELYLSELFSNLVTNALEASARGDSVLVAVTSEQEFYRVEIHNQQAIPEEIRENFFERNATARKDGGTGLGTYIAKMVTQVHGGSIDFSTSEEEGTTITVLLPRNLG